MLGSHGLAMQTPSSFHGCAFDFLTFTQDGLSSSMINVFRCQIFQALMIPPRIVVIDELLDVSVEIIQLFLKEDIYRE